jgi:hypothetical protein
MDSTKSVPGQVMRNLCFCFRSDLWVTKCILVHSGHETSMHYFLCSGGTAMDSTTSVLGHVTPNLCFLHLWIHYGKLEFYHSMGSTVHVVDFGAYRA